MITQQQVLLRQQQQQQQQQFDGTQGPQAWLQQGLTNGRRLIDHLGRTAQAAVAHLQHGGSSLSPPPQATLSTAPASTALSKQTILTAAAPAAPHTPSAARSGGLGSSTSSTSSATFSGGAPDKAELGRATWLLLHTLAAQFPPAPSRQQQRDARALIDALTRIYPCGDCARHFAEVVRLDPPDVSGGPELQQWLCRAHNVVNRRLDKPAFNCAVVGSRWAPLDCDEASSCDLTLGAPRRR